jgi:hypothetical protein
MKRQTSDDEFIDAFRQFQSVSEVAKLLKMTERNAHQRRRHIEKTRGIKLLSSSQNSVDRFDSGYEAHFPDFQHVEIKNGLVLAGSDWHLVPGYKSTAHRAFLTMVREMSPAATFDLGDLLDFSQISRHPRIGWDKGPNVKREVEWAGDCMDEIKKAGPKAMITKRTPGNHDSRFDGILANGNPHFEGVKGFALGDHLPGWGQSWAIRVNDQITLKHRYKGGMHSPFNNTLWSGHSYATGHQHKQQIYPLTDERGDRWGVDVGCMASTYGPTFNYLEAAPRNWRSGFAVFTFVDGKLIPPELVTVWNEEAGTITFRGQIIKV